MKALRDVLSEAADVLHEHLGMFLMAPLAFLALGFLVALGVIGRVWRLITRL